MAQPTVSSLILGPHFEHLCRVWTARFAREEGLGRPVGAVDATTLALFSRTGFEPDVRRAASGRADVLLVDLAHLYGVR